MKLRIQGFARLPAVAGGRLNEFAQQAGFAFAWAYLVYAVFFLFLPTTLGVHLLVLTSVALHPRSGLFHKTSAVARGGIRTAAEMVYGFANPVFYLLLLGPFLTWRGQWDGWLVALSWVPFIAIWAARLLVPRETVVGPTLRPWLHRLCLLGMGCIIAVATTDLVGYLSLAHAQFQEHASLRFATVVVLTAPLYLIPLLLLNHRRLLLQRSVTPGFFLPIRGVARGIAIAVVVIMAASIAIDLYRPSPDEARGQILDRRTAIQSAADRYKVDPALVAALVYVIHREQIGPVRMVLERVAMEVFLFEPNSHIPLAMPMNLSIGLAQIKPVTALTALVICQNAGSGWRVYSKHLRDVPPLGDAWTLPLSEQPCCTPMESVPRSKEATVAALSTEEGSLTFASMLLSLYQTQWRLTNANWDISQRPDIVATLYQIGFERSRPHASPRSNEFGRRVLDAYRQPWMQEAFPYPR